jgi:hypothetical protein
MTLAPGVSLINSDGEKKYSQIFSKLDRFISLHYFRNSVLIWSSFLYRVFPSESNVIKLIFFITCKWSK